MIKRFFVVLILVGIGLIFTGLLFNYVADTDLNQTGRYYAEHTAEDIGAANIVSAIIVTYRGLDTIGEVTVLFLTAAIVGLVLVREHNQHNNKPREAGVSSELLETGSRLLVPLIMLFGAYIIANGHLTPGGGFQGGAIFASGVLLMLLTNPLRHFSHRLITLTESISGVFFVLIGLLGLLLAGGFLDNRILPIGQFGELFSAGSIPIIYALIGLKVGAEFSSMLVDLSETEGQ
ncbi:MAG: sodium:proton antiporter [Gammaproteobacteria bacterium]|nr:sodium:proton antiporter [Gammaproteobacteria bacterium]